jgi:hypothetical protein
MIIRKKPNRPHALNEPLRHENHPKPMTRRDLIGAGFMAGPAVVTAPAWLGMLLKSNKANASLDADIAALRAPTQCSISTTGAGMIPFIAFDLAGGANLVGSEALVGLQGGQMNFLSSAGYSKLGLPGNMLPTSATFVSKALGLAWHADGAILRGVMSKASVATQGGVNGAVIAAMSQNDTQNNPHNPMYGIAEAGAKGSLLTLIGTQSSVSGGNSVAPTAMIDPTLQPTKIAQASDDTGLVNTGSATADPDAVAVLESQARISGGVTAFNAGSATPNSVFMGSKLGDVTVFADPMADATLKSQVRCQYVKSANTADAFGSPAALNPDLDTNIVGAAGIFSTTEYNSTSDYRSTAAVMKLVLNGYAGAGTITLGGFDYHDSTRATGEQRNFHAGVCIGAVLEYAKRIGTPVMIYVFSDGSLSSTGNADNSVNGRGKLGWQGDNQSTASTFFLAYSPHGRPTTLTATSNQIGYFNSDGSVNTTSSPAANAVNLLVQTVILNYLALHGMQGQFSTLFPMQGLGAPANFDALTALHPIV